MRFPIFERNIGAITDKEQRILEQSTVVVIGIGGLGGIAAEMLARAGIGKLILFDPDRIEITNINRQMVATFDTLDMLKVDVAKARIVKINSEVEVIAFPEVFRKTKADIYLECSDSAFQKAKNGRLIGEGMVCYGAAASDRGIVALLKGKDIEKTFMLPSRGKRISEGLFSKYKKCTSIFTGTAMITGALQAQQAINFLLGRPRLKQGELLIVKPFSRDMIEVIKIGD